MMLNFSGKVLGSQPNKINGRVKIPEQIEFFYHVKRYNDANSAVRKYKGTDLYLLQPAIFPSDPLDTMDVRYLNYFNALVISPLKNHLK